MDASTITAAKAFVEQLQASPDLVHTADLKFLKDYLLSLGANLPDPQPAAAPASASAPAIRLVPSLADWNALSAEAAGKPIVVDFFAEWCGPCKVIAPIFKELAEKHSPTLIFAKVDVDEASDIAQKYGITSMPTFRVFKDGQEVDQVVGANPVKLTAMVEKALAGGEAGATSRDVPMKDDPDAEPVVTEEELEQSEDDVNEDVLLDEMEKDPEVLPESERDVDPAPVPTGPIGAELSESDMDKQIELKGKASELAASGDLSGALAAWNEAIALSASPLTLAKRANIFLQLKQPYAAIRDCDAALVANPDSAKSLKIRGMAYRLLGDWENAAHSLQKGNQLDYDENAGEVQRIVEARWNKIRAFRLQKEAQARDRSVKKKAVERARARAAAIRRYEAEKKAETESQSRGMPGMPEGFPGMPGMPEGFPGMPGGMPDEMPSGTPGGSTGETPGATSGGEGKGASQAGLEKMLEGLDLPPDMKEKMKDPKVRGKLEEVFKAVQGNPSAAMATAMQYMNDPDVGPLLSSVMQAMMGKMGGSGGGMPGGMGGGMPGGMGGGMPGGMGGGMPGGMGSGMPGGGFGGGASDEVD